MISLRNLFYNADRYLLLRWSLGLVYLWFGALKLIGMSPVVEMIRGAYPLFASDPLYVVLALFEIATGLALFMSGTVSQWAAAAVAMHMTGTFGVLIFSPQIAFLPQFPFLTLEGEFVAKNLVLIAAAVTLLFAPGRPAVRESFRASSFLKGGVFALGAAAIVTLSIASQIVHHRKLQEAAFSTRSDLPVVSPAQISHFISRKDQVVTSGTVLERCELMGCWLKLGGSGSELFVDLASSNVSARAVPVGSRVQVAGRVAKTRLGTVGFVASALALVDSQ